MAFGLGLTSSNLEKAEIGRRNLFQSIADSGAVYLGEIYEI